MSFRSPRHFGHQPAAISSALDHSSADAVVAIVRNGRLPEAIPQFGGEIRGRFESSTRTGSLESRWLLADLLFFVLGFSHGFPTYSCLWIPAFRADVTAGGGPGSDACRNVTGTSRNAQLGGFRRLESVETRGAALRESKYSRCVLIHLARTGFSSVSSFRFGRRHCWACWLLLFRFLYLCYAFIQAGAARISPWASPR